MGNNKPLRIVFGEEILRLAPDYDFIVCSADTKCCAMENFGKEFPEREVSIGIAEQNLMGVASGIASCGNKVIVSTYSIFATLRACEQIRTYMNYGNLNVMIMGTHAGLQTGSEGTSHTAIEDIAVLKTMCNMTIIQPSDNITARVLAKKAVDFKGPLYVRLPFDAVEDVYTEEIAEEIEIGKAIVAENYGKDVSLIATGAMVHSALKAAECLRQKGINAQVLDVHTIKPLDYAAVLKTAQETNAVVTIEDHSLHGGLGGAIAEFLSENHPCYIQRIGIKHLPICSGDAKSLYKLHGMTEEDIVAAAEKVVAKKMVG